MVKTVNYKVIIGVIVGLLAAVFGVSQVYGAVTSRIRYVDNVGYAQNYTFLNATSTVGYATSTNTTDSNDAGYAVIAGAKRVELYLSRGGVSHANTGQSVFTVQVSPDGANWQNFSKIILATSTNQGVVSSVLTSGTSTVVAALDLRVDAFYGLRVVSQQVTDGESTAKAYVQF